MAEFETNPVAKPKTEQEQLQELITSAKNKITETEAIFEKAKTLVDNIETYYKSFDELKKNLDDDKTGMGANLVATQKAKSDIDIIQQSAEKDLESIRTSLATVQTNITAMKAAYVDFEKVNGQITEPSTGLAAVLKNADELKNQIEAFKTAASEGVKQMETNLASVNTTISTMDEAFKEFTAAKTKIDDKDNGLMAILASSETTKQEVIAVKKQSDTLYQEIKKFRDESQNYHKEIGVIKTEAESNAATIKKYEAESLDSKTKISKIYKLATDSSLANSFDERKRELAFSQWVWLGVFIASTLLLAVLVYKIFAPIFESNINQINAYTWYRLTITSPLLFLVAFASAQYAKDRNLLERYAFKAATAFALESYTTLLISTFDKEKNSQEILEFVLGSMKTIYEEPYQPIKESKWTVGVDAKSASVKAEHTKVMDDVNKTITTKFEDGAKKVVEVVKEKISETKSEETKV